MLPILISAPPRLREIIAGDRRSVNDTPEVRLEKLPLIFDRDFEKLAVDRDAGIIDPRIECAEMVPRVLRDLPQIALIARRRQRT